MLTTNPKVSSPGPHVKHQFPSLFLVVKVESAHVVALEEEEASYQDAIMKEVDEYQRLIAERNAQARERIAFEREI
jgi:hypothetical protein